MVKIINKYACILLQLSLLCGLMQRISVQILQQYAGCSARGVCSMEHKIIMNDTDIDTLTFEILCSYFRN